MKKFLVILMTAVFLAGMTSVMLPEDADAVPSFARQTGESCYGCHIAFPKLNEKGYVFKYNGYRFKPNKGDEMWDLETVPLAMKVEAEHESNWGDTTHTDSLKFPEIELFFVGPVGKRASVFVELAYDADPNELADVVLRLNYDLTGEGKFILSAGENEIEHDFLATTRDQNHQQYQADAIGHLPEVPTAEIFGQIMSSGAISSYRYSAGVVSDSSVTQKANKYSGLYGTLNLGFKGDHYLGVIYRYAEEDQGMAEASSVHRVSVAGELNFNPLIVTGGFFYTNFEEFSGGTTELDGYNFMIEAAYKINEQLWLLAREDYLWAERGSLDGNVNEASVALRYMVAANNSLQFEYRNEESSDLNDTDLSTVGTVFDDTEHKVRVFWEIAF